MIYDFNFRDDNATCRGATSGWLGMAATSGVRLSVPTAMVVEVSYRNGECISELVCHNLLSPGSIVTQEVIAQLFSGFETKDDTLIFSGHSYRVRSNGCNLIVQCDNEASAELGYIKYKLATRIRQILPRCLTVGELAQILLEATDGEKLFDQILMNAEQNLYVRYQAWKAVDFQVLSAAITAHYKDSWLGEVTSIYAEHYTSEELLELIFFYRSNLGVKVLNSMPAIATRFTDLSAQIAESLPSLIKDYLAREIST